MKQEVHQLHHKHQLASVRTTKRFKTDPRRSGCSFRVRRRSGVKLQEELRPGETDRCDQCVTSQPCREVSNNHDDLKLLFFTVRCIYLFCVLNTQYTSRVIVIFSLKSEETGGFFSKMLHQFLRVKFSKVLY